MTRGAPGALAAALLPTLVLAACGSGTRGDRPAARATPMTAPAEHDGPPTARRSRPGEAQAAAPGERRVTVRMPAAYTPSAPTGVGTDDYRCFLLDPEVAKDSFITGFNVLPGNPDVVHHVILFRVPPDPVADAEPKDAHDAGPGLDLLRQLWARHGASLDDAPWLGAWAPGGGERVYGKGFGVPLDAGSQVIMQVHYNLLAGTEPDTSAASCGSRRRPRTWPRCRPMLLPAPVELPCRPGTTTARSATGTRRWPT